MSWLSEATGIHISKHGVKIEPGKLLTDAMALTGNPAAIAALAGNAAKGISPNSTFGKIGSAVSTVGNIAAPLSGGLSGLTKLPGVSAITSKVGSLPGVSSVGSKVSGLLGLGGTPNLDPANAASMIGVTPSATAAGVGAGAAGAAGAASAGSGILGNVSSMLGLGDMSTADKLQLAKLGISTIGGVASGIQSANDRSKQLAELQREYNLPTAMTASRELGNVGLRNIGAAGLAGYAGAGPPAAFTPHDIFNAGGEGPGQPGGYDPAKVAAGTAAYKPSPEEEETYRRILAMTGFGGKAA